MKEIQTPSYWQEEEYQPLVKLKTLYGNQVMIPQKFQDSWEFQESLIEITDKRKEKGLTDWTGLEYEEFILKQIVQNGSPIKADLARVMLEIYQE